MGTYQQSPQFREFAFGVVRETLEQLLAGHKSKHRIAQEFELLIVLRRNVLRGNVFSRDRRSERRQRVDRRQVLRRYLASMS